MDCDLQWIDLDEELVRELERLGPGPLALDTEADSMHSFREKVCLVQLSAAGRILLIDPLAAIDLAPLGPWLADPTVRKILHGADYDVRMLWRDFSFEIRGLFDTMVAARLVGERSFGLAALLEKYLGVRLDKRFQRADWSRRPLPEPMRQYAASDTRYLEELARLLSERLTALGRSDWASEEFLRIERLRPRPGSPAEEAFQRIKGARRLDPRGLAVLRTVAELRDRIARATDRPRFRVVRDEVLLALAQAARDGRFDPDDLRGLPHSWRRGARRRELVLEVERALELPEAELPRLVRRSRPPRDAAFDARVRALCRERDQLAEKLDLEPSILASRTVLEEVQREIDRGAGSEQVPDLRRWQRELLEPLFRRRGA